MLPLRSVAGAYIRRYLLVHGAYLALVLSLLAWYGLSPGRALARFDGAHYLQIAATGYVDRLSFLPNGKPAPINIAFFPLYPLLTGSLHAVTRLPMEAAGLLLSLGASLATAAGLGVLLEPLLGRRTALLAVTIWAVGVDALIQSMLYAQPLIAAFAVWGTIALRKDKPLPAAACAIGAGLGHSTGVGLIVVVIAGSALTVRDAVRKRKWRATYAPAAAFALAPLGLLGYIGFLALRFHRPDTWFLAESAPGWSSQFDYGEYTARILLGQLDTTDWFAANGVPHLVATLWILPGALLMLHLLRTAARRSRLRPRSLPIPWELTVFSLVTFAVILTNSGPWGSKPRFLIPCLALCIPPAIGLANLEHRPRVQRSVLLALAAVSALCCCYLDGPSPSAL